jgi:hypothetical protein
MEEENTINLTGWDNLTTTTNGDYLVAGGNLLYHSSVTWNTTYDMDFKVPDVFLKVIKLMIPEIKNVIVSSSSMSVNPSNQIGELIISLFIVLDETSSGDKNYEERIRDLFRLTLPNIDYVTLNVKQFDSNSNKKFDELLKLFGK